MDGSTLEIAREDVREILPASRIIRSPHLLSDIYALISYHGKLLPIYVDESDSSFEIEDVHYIVVLKNKCLLSPSMPELRFKSELTSIDFSSDDWEDEIEKFVA